MNSFENRVQEIKYKVNREVSRLKWNGELNYQTISEISKTISPGRTSTMRCCIYKERAIVDERVKITLGGYAGNDHIIEVIDIACDDCPAAGYEVTELCRGCIAHRCEYSCPRGAISFTDKRAAHIDKNKCIGCGKCAKACPYSAIIKRERPCQQICPTGAIGVGAYGEAVIDYSKCISCGSCIVKCPFGAIMGRGFIPEVIDILKSDGIKVALLAPSYPGQCADADRTQITTGLKSIGFTHVIDISEYADNTIMEEAEEFKEKGFLMNSCCPAFTEYVRKAFPKLADSLSTTLSPMASAGKDAKEKYPSCRTVFIGPCIAKKAESLWENIKPYIDAVINFRELDAMFDGIGIDLSSLQKDNAETGGSAYGRGFAATGGVAKALGKALEEKGCSTEVKPCVCNGIDECRKALLMKNADRLDANFIEGMACMEGCLGGPGSFRDRLPTIKAQHGKYAEEGCKTISLASLKTQHQ